MPVTASSRILSIRAKRFCEKCRSYTEQICHSIKYRKDNPDNDWYQRIRSWVCSFCSTSSDEITDLPEQTDHTMLLRRLLRLSEDYDIKAVSIESKIDRIIVTIEFPQHNTIKRISDRYAENNQTCVNESEIHSAGLDYAPGVPVNHQ
jgi:hypothetical protein